MLKNSLKISIALTVFLWISGIAATGNSFDQLHHLSFYSRCIDSEIGKCLAKRRYLDSDSGVLREYGMREIQKAEFLHLEKDVLIHEMVRNLIDAKEYKVEQYINSRFTQSFSN